MLGRTVYIPYTPGAHLRITFSHFGSTIQWKWRIMELMTKISYYKFCVRRFVLTFLTQCEPMGSSKGAMERFLRTRRTVFIRFPELRAY